MSSIIRLILIIALLLLISCDKETDIEIPYSGNKMVVKSFLFTDQPIKVELSESRPLDSGLITWIKDATIKLYENNNYIEDIICDNHHYYISPSNYRCKAGSEYTIYIYHENFGGAEASVNIPNIVTIKIVDTFSINKLYTSRSWVSWEGGEKIYSRFRIVLCTKIEIIDPPDEKNYYILDITQPSVKFEFPEPHIYSNPVSYDSDEKLIDGWIENPINQYSQSGLYSAFFSDKLFDGNYYILTIFLKNDMPLGRIYIKLYSISEGYYNYIKSVQEWNKNKDNPFTEPVIIYSNIANGIGILGGASCYVDSSLVIQ